MEALRSQLKEVQGHLTDRDITYRQLKHDFKTEKDSWATAKQGYESRIKQLEKENRRLREIAGVGGNVVTFITQAEKEEVESRIQKTTLELSAKTEQCETLKFQLRLLESRTTPGVAQDVSEAYVADRFATLRERIRNVSLKRFNQSTAIYLIPEKSREELGQLSSRWRSYMGSQMICYLLRALIWRYIHSALFIKAGRIWGQDIRNSLRTFAEVLPPKVPSVAYQSWRIETGQLLQKACAVDPTVLDAITKQIFEATRHFATEKNADDLQKSIHEIVTIGGELSAIFARSHYEPLMSDMPGSVLTRDFPFSKKTMEIKARSDQQNTVENIVEMMITPCLLKKDGEYSVVMKAEVVC